MPNYSYRRVVASNPKLQTYAERLTEIQTYFVGHVMEGVYDYVLGLHQRLAHREPWSNLSFFESWDYGYPRPDGGPGKYEGRIWMKSGSVPNLGSVIQLHVKFDESIEVKVVTDEPGKHLITTKYPFQTTPSTVALAIGERWERELTGNVEWANDDER